MENFTPFTGFLGGLLIGLAALFLMASNRQICGISGMIEGILPPVSQDAGWRGAFVAGLVLGGASLHILYPRAFEFSLTHGFLLIFIGGFLVGFGSRLGMGCTSGHGVCGVGRMAKRSIAATLIFLLSGMATATLMAVLGGRG